MQYKGFLRDHEIADSLSGLRTIRQFLKTGLCPYLFASFLSILKFAHGKRIDEFKFRVTMKAQNRRCYTYWEDSAIQLNLGDYFERKE